MKTATLMLCLMASLMTSGCIISHKETIGPRHHEEQTRPEGVASRAADVGTAR